MKEFLFKLIGGKDCSIPSKFLRIILIVVSIHFFTHLIMALMGRQMGNLIVTGCGFVFFLSMYLFLYFTGRETPLKVILFIITILMLTGSWLTNAGILGATPVFFILSVFGFIAIVSGRYHIITTGLLLLLYAALNVIEIIHPEWINAYITSTAHRNDVLFSTLIICVVISIVFSLMIRRLENQNQVLEEKVREQFLLSEKIENQYHNQIELNKALDSFVYRSSHDLRAPISSALGLIEITKSATSQEEVEHYLNLQQKSLKKLDTFINDILFYSQNRSKSVQMEPVPLEALINESLIQIQHLPSYHRIRVIRDISLQENILSDPLRLRIIFNNLISNAYKYYDLQKTESYLKISINKKGNNIEIQFEDNGLGIEEELIPRIYDMFFRATYKAEGTGIGLYIVKEAIEKMKGQIHCHSKTSEGTTFTISIPYVEAIEKAKVKD
ncbi:MAG: HAMP domain-containing histidine kinase [Bacteroidia bacterium]|nr:HAMP domain-containing histidine kinase [Bacteroidia bacterium]